MTRGLASHRGCVVDALMRCGLMVMRCDAIESRVMREKKKRKLTF